jgi:hypothetical protein
MARTYWEHSADRRQWELMRDDDVYEPRRISYVTDEFLTQAAMPPETLAEYVRSKWPEHPLPEEAFARG